jgi:hypothetical protein
LRIRKVYYCLDADKKNPFSNFGCGVADHKYEISVDSMSPIYSERAYAADFHSKQSII